VLTTGFYYTLATRAICDQVRQAASLPLPWFL